MAGKSVLGRAGFGRLAAVGDLGIGSWIARSRRRLFLSTAATTAFFVAYCMVTAGYIRSSSQSVGLNLVFITGVFLLILLTAFVQSMLVGDLLFPGKWRERVLLGRKVELAETEALQASIGKLKDQTIPFYLVALALIGVNYGVFSLATGNFLGDYNAYGYQLSLLRSDDPADRIRGLRNLAHPLRAEACEHNEVRETVLRLVSDPSAEVRGWAFWLIGENQIYEAASPLRAIVENDGQPDEIRARAAETLGRLRDPEGAALMASILADSFGRDELALGLLRGLGLARLDTTARRIAPLLSVEPTEIRAYAFWALGQTGNPDYRPMLVEYLESDSVEDQCFAAEALKFVAKQEDLVQAHTLFATGAMTPCPGVEWRTGYHWDEDRSFRQEIIVEEPLRAKFLKMVFAAGGASERDFFATVANDESEQEEIRRLAREIALRIDHRR